MLLHALESGAGLEKLREMVEAQGGEGEAVTDVRLLPQAKLQIPVPAEEDGFVAGIDALEVGLIARGLGAGRVRKEDVIDPAVGLILHCRVGDAVRAGDTLAVIYANDEAKGEQAARALLAAVRVGKEKTESPKLLYAVISEEGMELR